MVNTIASWFRDEINDCITEDSDIEDYFVPGLYS